MVPIVVQGSLGSEEFEGWANLKGFMREMMTGLEGPEEC